MKPRPDDYAGIVSRGAAFSIDVTLALIVVTVGFQFVRGALAAVGVSSSANEGGGLLGYLLALPVVFGVYCAGFWALVGRTLGMMLLGLRVVKADGEPPGFRRSIMRALGYWVSAFLLLGFVWIAVDKRNQGFHDKIAGTFVVYDWDARESRAAV